MAAGISGSSAQGYAKSPNLHLDTKYILLSSEFDAEAGPSLERVHLHPSIWSNGCLAPVLKQVKLLKSLFENDFVIICTIILFSICSSLQVFKMGSQILLYFLWDTLTPSHPRASSKFFCTRPVRHLTTALWSVNCQVYFFCFICNAAKKQPDDKFENCERVA